jgi:hypothetical protein
MPDRIDDLNRRVLLSTDESGTIKLYYDRFEKKIYVEDSNELLNFSSDGEPFKPVAIPEKVQILYSAALNGVLSIKFSGPIDRRSLSGISVTDYGDSTSYGKIIDFLENDTLVLMAYENSGTMRILGSVTDKTKNTISIDHIVALPVVYLLFDKQEDLSNYWKFNKIKLTGEQTIDVTDKDFVYEYNADGTINEYSWMTDEWKTFYYDATMARSYSSTSADKLGSELIGKWALCYLRQVPTGFKGEKDGPHWYATSFDYDMDNNVQITGWIPDILSYFEEEALLDYYKSVGGQFSKYEDAILYIKSQGEPKFDSFIFLKGDIWYFGEGRKQIQEGSFIVTTESKIYGGQITLIITFKDYKIVNISNVAGKRPIDGYLVSGSEVTFTKVDYDDPASKTAQDVISEGGIILTRGNNGGLYNVAKESVWSSGLSPEGTEWNSNYTDALYGWSDLSNVTSRKYGTFLNALDGSIGNNILKTELVMRDINSGQYWKFEFHSWTQGDAGGGFSYTRTLIDTQSRKAVDIVEGEKQQPL